MTSVTITRERWRALLGLLAVILSLQATAGGQNADARVAGLSGGTALRVVSGRGSFQLKKGDGLMPGDRIDTRGGAKVVIEMSDGSLITVLPGSQVVLRDLQSAGSLRDILEILGGRVRLKVNRVGGRPNPVRVNTPTASIAVRGTEFGVIVAPGETAVAVYEGLVEVISRSAPDQRALVEPGQAVTIRQNDIIRFFVPGPGSEIGELNERRNLRKEIDKHQTTAIFARGIAGGDVLRNQAGEYQRQIQSIIEPGESPPLTRFLAYAEPYLDSQENPAFAGSFRSISSRLLFLSSIRSIRGAGSTRSIEADASLTGPYDYGGLYQGSVYLPLGGSRYVLGGGFTHTLAAVRGLDQAQIDLTPPPSLVPVTGERTISTRTTSQTRIGSIILARNFGAEERTSIGIGIDHVEGSGTLSGATTLVSSAPLVPGGLGFSGLNVREDLEATSSVSRFRFRAGITHQFSNGHRLAVHYHRGIGSAHDRDETRFFNGLPLPLDRVEIRSEFQEFGMRLRGPITPRLYYGIESSWLDARIDETIRRSVIVPASERRDLGRALFGGGFGFVLRPGTLLSMDLSAGRIFDDQNLSEDSTGNPLERKTQSKTFYSMHLAAQSDIWKGIFAGASVLGLGQRFSLERSLFPDQYGRRLTGEGLFATDGLTRNVFTDPLADLNVGLRLKNLLVLQYVYTTDFGRSPSSHILMLRFDFGRKE